MRKGINTITGKLKKASISGLFLFLCVSPLYAGTLTLEGTFVESGTTDFTLTVDLAVAQGESVAALDFTLNYDASKLIFNSAAESLHLQASGKQLQVHEAALGTVRGVIYGLNSALVTTGDLFDLSFTKINGAADGHVTLEISDTNVSDENSNAVTLTVINNSTFLNVMDIGTPPDVPIIQNNQTLINQDNFSLTWTDESASGAAGYYVTKMAVSNSVSPANYTNGLVGYWPMDDVGSDAADEHGSNVLSGINSVGYSASKPFGIVRGSKSFDAANQDELQSQTQLDFNAKMSWSAWVKPDAIDSKMTIINNWKDPSDSEKSYRLEMAPGGVLRGIVSSDGITQNIVEGDYNSITAGKWQNVMFMAQINEAGNPFLDDMENHTPSVSGVGYDQTILQYGSGSGDFRSKATVQVSDSSDWHLATNDFTIDFWIRPTSFSDDDAIISKSQSENVFWRLEFFKSGGKDLRFMASSGVTIGVQNHGMTPGQWHHVAVVRNGSSGKIYIDGQDRTTMTSGVVWPIYEVSSPLYIGSRNSGKHHFKGHLDDVRIVNGSAKYTSNFTPTAQSSGLQDSDTKLLMRFDVVDDLSLFVDGVELATTVKEETETNLVSGSAPFQIGAGNNGTHYWDGEIAEVAFWNRELSLSERTELSFGNREITSATGVSSQETGLEDGAYIYMVQSHNGTGASSAFSPEYQIQIDTTPPSAPTIQSPAALTNQVSLQVEGTVDTDTDSLSLVGDNGLVINQQPVITGLNWTASVTAPNDGTFTLQAMATDTAGNLSTVANHTFEVDTTAPVITSASPASNTYTVPLKTVLFQGSLDDSDVTTGTFRYTNGNGGTTDIPFPVTAGQFNFSHTLNPGSNQCVLIFNDLAGNQSTEVFNITYANNLPLVFNGLTNQMAVIDEDTVSFIVSITHQNDIEPELLTFAASNLPGNGNNAATFDPVTRVFTWSPTNGHEGLHAITFSVSDDDETVTQDVKIVVQAEAFDEAYLNDLLDLPTGNVAKIADFDQDGFEDIYVTLQGENKLYQNLGDGTFANVAAAVGVNDNGLGNGSLVEDLNNDGWLDIYVINEGPNTLYTNNQDGTFTDETTFYNLDDAGNGKNAISVDFDNDGLRDIYILNDGENSYLKKAANGTYADLTFTSGLGDLEEGVTALAADFNGDGLKDIYVINEGKNKFFLNDGVHKFTDASGNVSGNVQFNGFLGLVRDIDLDGDFDIILVNHTKDIIYQNDGAAQFKKMTISKPQNTSIQDKFALFTDYNNDQSLDIFVVDRNSKYVDGLGNFMFRNDGNGDFTDTTAISNLF